MRFKFFVVSPIFSDGSTGAKKVKLTQLKVSGCSGGMGSCSMLEPIRTTDLEVVSW